MDNREPTRVRENRTKVTKTTSGIERVEACRAIVAASQYAKVDGIMVDLFSASAIVKVYDALNEANRNKLCALPIQRMAAVCFKLLK